MEKFLITKDTTRKIKKFNLTGRTISFKIRSIPENNDPVAWIKDSIEQIVAKVVEDVEPNDKIGFTFCSKEFNRGDGWIPLKQASCVKFEDIWDMVSSVYQSNSLGLNTETFCLSATSIKMPRGTGRPTKFNNFDEECAKRKGIIVIKNKDHLCLPRAIVVAKAYADNNPDKTKIRSNETVQLEKTYELLGHVGMDLSEEGSGIPELEKFQEYLVDYSITVYEYDTKGRGVIYKGVGGKKKINLLYRDNHYNVIVSLTAAFSCKYYCEECHTPFNNNKNSHRCFLKCPACQQTPPCSMEKKIMCDCCNRWFRGQKCFDMHKLHNVCDQVVACKTCLKTFPKNREHTCGEFFCKVCNKHVPSPHNCFMPIDSREPTMSGILFIFYDLECTQETTMSDGSLLHKPNLCVYQQHCENCIGTDIWLCSCGLRQQVLKIDPVNRFMEYIMNQRKQFKKIIVVGHAGGLYDNQFMLNYILTTTKLKPELITRGTKLLLMRVDNVDFIDSLNYFPMPLAKLPKTFGLKNVKKGYFPHLFNKKENWDYVGPLPPLKYYDPESLTYTPTLDEEQDAKNQLIAWHTELSNQDYVFDFQKELVEYCVSDVTILAQACLKFRELMLKEGGVDPFTEAITLPGACNKIFRRNFLKPQTIGLVPKNGYRCRDTQSKIAIRWLLCEENRRGIKIEQAFRGREKVLCGVKVDGYCQETKQVFEFHGCYYHGCPRCIKFRRDDYLYDDPSATVESRYEATLAKTERLKTLGYEVIEKWECDFRRELLENPDITDIDMMIPLEPRDAFYGGRTDATKLYYSCKEGEKIRYVDVCSLYPWVNKYGKYPIGHPSVFVGKECSSLDLRSTDGLIKCKIIPPNDLYHPVLPIKLNNKLIFPLCFTCCKNTASDECLHSDEEKALSGTWVIDEVLKALEKGYKMVEIYEIWKYKIEQYDPESKTGGLFSEYISKFLKIKQQASGWPCKSEEDKLDYIKEYFDKEGVQLCPDEIESNPGCRQIGKSVITSFWGKLGQRENQDKTSIVIDTSEFFDILSKPFINVNNIHPVNEDVLLVNWSYKDEAYNSLPTVNVVLAAYTTAQARLKLYSYLEKLDDRVLYHDTDSVIYISRPGQYEVPVGKFLGEMTDELADYGEGSFITDFVSGGPKMYAYRVYSTNKNKHLDIIKVKGITLNYKTQQLVNFEKLRDMVLNEAPEEYITTRNILRTRLHEVVTKQVTKVFRTNFFKRKRIENFDSVPFGFKKTKL